MRAAILMLMLTGTAQAESLSLAYAYASARVRIAVYQQARPDNVSDICPACNGEGEVGDGRIMVICQTCNGLGRITQTQGEAPPREEITPFDRLFDGQNRILREITALPDRIKGIVVAQPKKTASRDRLILITADWCAICPEQKSLIPAGVTVEVMDYDEARKWGPINSVPSWFVVVDGKTEFFRGMRDKEWIESQWNRVTARN